MFDGLAWMNEGELAEIARLVGVEKPPASREVLHEIATVWLSRAVRMEGKPREEVERAVLETTAEAFKIPFSPGTDLNDLEREIRRKIARDAVQYLESSWAIICALVAVGKSDNISGKLTLLEQAASLPVPSRAITAEQRTQWERLCSRWAGTDPLPELAPHISNVMSRSERGVECLTVGLALSLLDGSVSFPTERLYREVAGEFGLDRGQSDNLQKRVTNLYWQHHNAAQPASNQGGGFYDPVVAATRQTVYEAGGLEALATDARAHLFTQLEPEQKKSGWSRLVSSVMGDKKVDKATVARIACHAIIKQHVVVAARSVEAEIQAAEEEARTRRMPPPKPDPFTAGAPAAAVPVAPQVTESELDLNPPPPPPLAEKVEHVTPPKRRISLDP